MKKLFEIDNSERQRILEMHIDATKNLYIIEQGRVQASGGIKGEIPSPFKREKSTYRSDISSIQSKKYNQASEGEKEKLRNSCLKYVNQYNELVVSKINKDELPLWEEIKKNSPCFAYDVVSAIKSNSWIKSVYLKRKTFESTVVDTGEPTKINGAKKPSSPALRFTTEENYPTADYFSDNSYELSQKGKSDVLSIIQTITDTKNEFISKGFKNISVCIDNLNINSSASRLRNKSAKTFLELSKNRAESMKNYIMSQLNEIGVNTWCNKDNNIVLNFKGDNGDGTSGPNPPKGFNYIAGGENVPMEPPMKDDSKRNEFGAPLTAVNNEEVRKLYDKFKYSKLDMTVAFNYVAPDEKGGQTPPDKGDPVPVPIDDAEKKYSAIFFGKDRGKFKFRIGVNLLAWWPRFKISLKNKGIRTNKGVKDCGAYN
jgi:hypothetical protein